jgi:membrane protease YdiL (CAAX protease family)
MLTSNRMRTSAQPPSNLQASGQPSSGQQASGQPSSMLPTTHRLGLAATIFIVLLGAFWLIARFFHLKALDEFPVSTVLSFALLFAPYWFFGFGLASVLRSALPGYSRIACSALLTVPYFVLTIPRGTVNWPFAATLIVICLLVAAALQYWPTPANWADIAVLLLVGLLIDLGLLNTAWPFGTPGSLWPAGLGGFPKMMMANLALYGYLVIKPIDGIGYDLAPRFSDLKTGLREFLFYSPFVLSLGFLLGFLHWQGAKAHPLEFPGAWIFTLFFVALPEELYFRGLVQNLLERHMGRNAALITASILFGLSHFNTRTIFFNWRYVLLAAIAGFFYGRAWRERKRLLASSVTHATVDTVWSIWFR